MAANEIGGIETPILRLEGVAHLCWVLRAATAALALYHQVFPPHLIHFAHYHSTSLKLKQAEACGVL